MRIRRKYASIDSPASIDNVSSFLANDSVAWRSGVAYLADMSAQTVRKCGVSAQRVKCAESMHFRAVPRQRALWADHCANASGGSTGGGGWSAASNARLAVKWSRKSVDQDLYVVDVSIGMPLYGGAVGDGCVVVYWSIMSDDGNQRESSAVKK